MALTPKVLGDDDPEATAAMDLNTVAMDQPKPETAPPSTLEPARELPSAPAPEAPIREEVSMNNDAPTRIRVSTLDAYGTQGGQTGLACDRAALNPRARRPRKPHRRSGWARYGVPDLAAAARKRSCKVSGGPRAAGRASRREVR